MIFSRLILPSNFCFLFFILFSWSFNKLFLLFKSFIWLFFSFICLTNDSMLLILSFFSLVKSFICFFILFLFSSSSLFAFFKFRFSLINFFFNSFNSSNLSPLFLLNLDFRSSNSLFNSMILLYWIWLILFNSFFSLLKLYICSLNSV